MALNNAFKNKLRGGGRKCCPKNKCLIKLHCVFFNWNGKEKKGFWSLNLEDEEEEIDESSSKKLNWKNLRNVYLFQKFMFTSFTKSRLRVASSLVGRKSPNSFHFPEGPWSPGSTFKARAPSLNIKELNKLCLFFLNCFWEIQAFFHLKNFSEK